MAKRRISSNPLQPLLDQIPTPLRNRYFLVLALFFGWLIFFDKHDVLTQYSLQKTLNKLKADKVFYEERIEQAKEDRLDMELNQEKFAREKYYMQKNNEDVFIIVEKED